MKGVLDFILQISKLKKIQRTGWLKRGVKDPETIAQHTFRVALMNWLLGKTLGQSRLKIDKVIKSSLVHDLSEVYIGDITPYEGLIFSDDPKEIQKAMKRWIRLPRKEKQKRAEKKFRQEKEVLSKLISALPAKVRYDIMRSWLDYEELSSLEGKFVRQTDKIETLLQALEYFGPSPNSFAVAWWEEVEELVDEPGLKNFLHKIEAKFSQKKEADPLLSFILEIGKLKKFARRGWVARRIKNPETIADHSFEVALMTWVLAKEERIDLEKALKIALIHEICAIYAGDLTPHDIFGEGLLNKWFKIWKVRPTRMERERKQKKFLKIYKKETLALQKLINSLPENLKYEILNLWTDFVEKKSKESDFVDQVNCLATFLQALEYWQKDKKLDIRTFAEATLEFIHHPVLIGLLEEIYKKFEIEESQKKSLFSFLVPKPPEILRKYFKAT
jgi:putative hydrolase of HD superfamily